ncbi:hypothetical protein ROT00_17220 [Agromyces mediolanus]|uniref:hypothetical protein n=1 Tax=Agromyces mediolanus TaxID=41986 RepID=UPI0038351193
MRRIGIVPATIIVATWLFIIGFAFGYLGRLDSGATPATDGAALAGLLTGAAAVAIAAATLVAVRLVRTAARAVRSRDAKHAG